MLAELNFINEVFLYSDKCSTRELQKLNEEFTKALNSKFKVLKVPSIWKYIKDETGASKTSDEKDEVDLNKKNAKNKGKPRKETKNAEVIE